MGYELMTCINFLEWVVAPSVQLFLGACALGQITVMSDDELEDHYLRQAGYTTLVEAWDLHRGAIKKQILSCLKSQNHGTRDFGLECYNQLVLEGVQFPAKFRREVSRLIGANTEGVTTPRKVREPKPGHREKFIQGDKPRARGGNSKRKGKRPWREN